jgi:DNA-binding NtrC family response regulator
MTSPLNILLVDDEAIVHESIGRYLTKCGHRVTSAKDAGAALRAAGGQPFDVAFVDVRMPGMDGVAAVRELRERHPDLVCVTITGHADVDTAVEAMRAGAQDLLRKPIELSEIDAVLARRAVLAALRRENRHLRAALRRAGSEPAEFLGDSPAARRVREQIALAAEARCDRVLITGETGSGKEVAARHLHALSPRAEGPFVPLNCPAVPASILESELFGHRKGAFTGATEAREGCFEIADGGTLFLDEIADLPLTAQAALLRAVETRRVRRVGGGPEVEVDLCLVTASNRDLVERVAAGAFRQDLYYRLNAFHVAVPPLRERREDIPLLARRFLDRFRSGRALPVRDFSDEALAAMADYGYPGNLRELRNLVEHAAVVCRAECIRPEHLAFVPAIHREPAPPSTGGAVAGTAPTTASDDERARLAAALDRTRWNRRKAAELLGMSYSTLREKIARYALR